jgi:hypothetical protein
MKLEQVSGLYEEYQQKERNGIEEGTSIDFFYVLRDTFSSTEFCRVEWEGDPGYLMWQGAF